MIISFDLDGVLFVDPVKFEIEPVPNFPFRLYYPERLRKGTVDLIHRLKEQDIRVWVYTSSYRRESYIRGLFWHYGVRFDRIINAAQHDRDVQRDKKERLPLKMPNFYRITMHIDDEDSVVQNGKDYGFHVLQVKGPDPLWTEKVFEEACRLLDIEKNRR